MAKRAVVVSGMRPTGRLHLGNYWGALKNWVALTGSHDCYYFVADLHMLTTGYDDTSRLQENSKDMVLDWLAAGLDPEKCVMFRQSDVPEHAGLAMMLGMVTPLSWLENNPTWKEQLQELAKTKHSRLVTSRPAEAGTAMAEEKTETSQELRTFGFLGYPVLQTADVLLYHAAKVPVGQDQLPHLELSREIARKFNNAFGEVFPEPQPLLTPTPKIPGTDGRKMSKSYGNTVDIYESEATLKTKVMSMYTDPAKIGKNDPGHPEPCEANPPGCSVFALHKLYADDPFVQKRKTECIAGRIGCVACKKDLYSELEKPFANFRERREKYVEKPGLVDSILAEGAKKAGAAAQKTMAEVRRAMSLS